MIEINSAVYIGDYAIRILFNDGVCKLVDFKTFLESSYHPSIKKYLDETHKVWEGERIRRLPVEIQEIARRKLRMLNKPKTYRI